MEERSQRELAQLLASLRREGRQQSGLRPDLVPPDLLSAYRVAAMVAEELDWVVGGWKIAAQTAELQRALRTNRPIYGRVYARDIRAAPVSVEYARQCSPIPEVEYQALLGKDLPLRDRPYSIEEVGDAVASLHPGIELAECRFIHDASFPPLAAIVADGSGSGGIAYGPAIENWRDRDVSGQEVVLSSNGQVRRMGTAAAAVNHPLVPLTWLANELAVRGTGLKRGEMVSTGTLTGMLRPRLGDRFTADYGPLGSVAVTYE